MIVVVCLNPAWDVTYTVPDLVVGETNRVGTVARRLGGKGLNVARVLTSWGEPVRVVVPQVMGPEGEEFDDELLALEVPPGRAGSVAGVRRTTAVVAPGSTTMLNEPGSPWRPGVWREVPGAVAYALNDADVLVLSGSLPPGVPDDAYGVLVGVAREMGVASVVDASGAALAAALAAGPTVVKPNAAELADLLALTTSLGDHGTSSREEVNNCHDHEGGVGVATTLGASVVARGGSLVASFGADGLVAVTPGGSWRARPPSALPGNPTGAGDAVVAVLARALAQRPAGGPAEGPAGGPAGGPDPGGALDWPAVLREAVAWSASAVACDLAGEVDVGVHDAVAPQVEVAPLVAPPG